MEGQTKRQINADIKKTIKNILNLCLIDKIYKITQIKLVPKKYKNGDEIWLEIYVSNCTYFVRHDFAVNDIITYKVNNDLDYILTKYKYFVGHFWENVGDNEMIKNDLKYFLNKLIQWIDNNFN